MKSVHNTEVPAGCGSTGLSQGSTLILIRGFCLLIEEAYQHVQLYSLYIGKVEIVFLTYYLWCNFKHFANMNTKKTIKKNWPVAVKPVEKVNWWAKVNIRSLLGGRYSSTLFSYKDDRKNLFNILSWYSNLKGFWMVKTNKSDILTHRWVLFTTHWTARRELSE